MSRESEKHNRGEHWSPDEELTTPKHANEAVTVDEDGASKGMEVSEEPSNLELWEMFVDIQITVNNILLENKKISNDVLQLKATVQKQQAELATLTKKITKKLLKNATKELSAAINKIDKQQEEKAELYNLQDRLEQYTWKNS